MGVAVSGCLFVWAVGGLGRLEGLLLRKGGWSCLVGWFSRVWLACPCWYRRHTLCCLCLVVVGAPLLRAWCVWGWHAVGVLGQCALGCPARPGFHFLGFWVGVGGLVVNCIVDASILL